MDLTTNIDINILCLEANTVKKISVSKELLSNKSEFFASLFDNICSENVNNSINLVNRFVDLRSLIVLLKDEYSQHFTLEELLSLVETAHFLNMDNTKPEALLGQFISPKQISIQSIFNQETRKFLTRHSLNC